MDNGTYEGNFENYPFKKGQDYSDALALVVEPLGVRENKPSKFGVQDYVDAKVTVFWDEDAVNGKTDPVVEKVCFSNKPLTKDFVARTNAGNWEPTVVKAQYVPATAGNNAFWGWTRVDPAIFERVVAAYEAFAEKADDEDQPSWA